MVARGEEELRGPRRGAGRDRARRRRRRRRRRSRAAVDGFAASAGGIDLLVANAGVLHYAPFAEQPLSDAEQMVRVNVLGTIYTVKAALPHMLDAARGHIVVVSSGAGLRAFPWGAVYGATKAADRALPRRSATSSRAPGSRSRPSFRARSATEIHSHQRDRLPDWRATTSERPVEELVAAILDGVETTAARSTRRARCACSASTESRPASLDRLLAAVRGGSAAPRRD